MRWIDIFGIRLARMCAPHHSLFRSPRRHDRWNCRILHAGCRRHSACRNAGLAGETFAALSFRSRGAPGPPSRCACVSGLKLGGALLWDAVDRAARSEVAVYALVVDGKDDQAERFYRHHGFTAFASTPKTLILPLKPGNR